MTASQNYITDATKVRMGSAELTAAEKSMIMQTESKQGESFNAPVSVVHAQHEYDFMTRNGLNIASFKKRDYGHGIVGLDDRMKPRHLNMIAIGGSIGAGFFVGSGSALYKGVSHSSCLASLSILTSTLLFYGIGLILGVINNNFQGPATLLIDFFIVGIMIFNVVYALGELAVMFPVTGGFYTYSARFIDPSWGFAMGWNYVLQGAVLLPLELTVSAITIQYWTAEYSPAVWITVFFIAIIIANIFGSLGYAEEEYWASMLKLAAIVIFMIISMVLVCGGGPSSGRYNEYWGARLWHDPGAFKNGFKGFCSCFVTAAFAFSGTELVGLAAAEAQNPTKSLPSAIKQVFWRITLFYILGLFFVGLLISSDDENLLSDQASDVNTSPFVLAGKYAGLKGLDNFMNVVILVSVLSVGVSAVYGGSRTLTALAQQGFAPKVFTFIDRSGRPMSSVVAMILCGFLSYITLAADGWTVFDWLLALSGLAALFTWGSICLAHIRFRQAWLFNGHSLDEIPFRAIGGVYGSWLGLILVAIVIVAQIYTAIAAPPGESGVGTAEDFFKQCLAIPVVIAFWIAGYFWKRTGWLRVEQIDVDTGRREHDWEAIRAHRAQVASYPMWRRVLHAMF